MTYIASMESIECVDTSNVSNEVLISVTSTPIKGQSGEFSNSTIDGDLAVENVPNANDLAVENEQNTTEEVESVSNEPNPVAESDNEQIDKEPSATGDTKLVEVDSTEPTELLAIQTESLNSEAPTIDAPVELEATATDEIQTEPIPISTKSANETEKPSEIEEQLEVENQLEIENQTDTEPIENQIETAANETDDAAPEKEPVANETVDEEKVDDEKKSDAAADSVPIVSNASPDLTVIPEVQVPAEVEPKVHADSDAADGEIELAFSECDLADEVIATQDSELANDECIDETAAQISDEIEIDEKSAIEQIKQIATDHEVEVEVEVESDSENVRSSEMVQDESNGCLKIVSVEGNSSFHDVEVLNLVSPECDEKEVSEGGELDEMVHSVSSEEPQLLTGFDKMELLQIGVRRKRSASLTLNRFDGATKKWKLEEKCPTDGKYNFVELIRLSRFFIEFSVLQRLFTCFNCLRSRRSKSIERWIKNCAFQKTMIRMCMRGIQCIRRSVCCVRRPMVRRWSITIECSTLTMTCTFRVRRRKWPSNWWPKAPVPLAEVAKSMQLVSFARPQCQCRILYGVTTCCLTRANSNSVAPNADRIWPQKRCTANVQRTKWSVCLTINRRTVRLWQ